MSINIDTKNFRVGSVGVFTKYHKLLYRLEYDYLYLKIDSTL